MQCLRGPREPGPGPSPPACDFFLSGLLTLLLTAPQTGRQSLVQAHHVAPLGTGQGAEPGGS